MRHDHRLAHVGPEVLEGGHRNVAEPHRHHFKFCVLMNRRGYYIVG
jgi:hypothetical protein